MIKQIIGWALLMAPFIALSIFLWKEVGYRKVLLFWGMVAIILGWANLTAYLIS